MSDAADRQCGTCRHFEPSKSWRRGWCRNTLLFSPGQSHIVQYEELDCSRGSGDFWEAPRDFPNESLENAGQSKVKLPNISNPLKLFSPVPVQPSLSAAGMGGNVMFASGSGGGGGEYDPDDYDYEVDDAPPQPERRPRQPRSTRATAGDSNGRSRTAQFQPEERYWTDYLRIALPVIGLLLMIGLLWYWAQSIINDDPATTEPSPTESIGLVTESTPTPEQEQVLAPPPADEGEVSTPPAVTDQPAQEEEAPPEEPVEEEPAGEEPADTGATFSDGELVVVTEALNLRPDPSTAGEPVAQLAVGDELTIVGGPEEGDSFTWWEVLQADGTTSGWVVEDFIEPAG